MISFTPGIFTAGERCPCIHWTEGSVGPTTVSLPPETDALVSTGQRVRWAPQPFLYRRRKMPLYPLDRGLGGPHNRSVRSTSSSMYLLPLSAMSGPWPSTISHMLFQRLTVLTHFDTLQHVTACYLQEVLPWQKHDRENCSVML